MVSYDLTVFTASAALASTSVLVAVPRLLWAFEDSEEEEALRLHKTDSLLLNWAINRYRQYIQDQNGPNLATNASERLVPVVRRCPQSLSPRVIILRWWVRVLVCWPTTRHCPQGFVVCLFISGVKWQNNHKTPWKLSLSWLCALQKYFLILAFLATTIPQAVWFFFPSSAVIDFHSFQ